jgi:hypothetical protein
MSSECRHITQEFRGLGEGLWCTDCGAQIYAVERRPCKDCARCSILGLGAICGEHLMRVAPEMRVTYRVDAGSCWKPRDASLKTEGEKP